MNSAVFALAVFGAFTIIGGLIGYFKAQSVVSLIAGVTSGLVLLVSAYGVSKNVKPALMVGFLVSVMLGVRFLMTWLQNQRVMPDLIVVVLSMVTLICVLMKWIKP